jgi:L-rhamnose mutarotase
MRRYGSVVKLAEGAQDEYRRLHQEVWLGVTERMAASHIASFTIFLRDGLLFSYMEYTGDDFEADMAAISADETTRRWWDITEPLQQPVASAADGEWWAPMEEVFHFHADSPSHSPS